MIFDSLENLKFYGSGELWDRICEMALSLDASSPDGLHPIQGAAAYCLVMEYPTKPPSACRIEGHRNYVDIQFSLSGAEGIDVFSPIDVERDGEYDVEKDVEFYTSENAPTISTTNKVGFFTLLRPHDLHRPQVIVEPKGGVRKAVIKVETRKLHG